MKTLQYCIQIVKRSAKKNPQNADLKNLNLRNKLLL